MATVPATPKAKTKAGSFHGVPVWVIAIGGVGVAYLGWRWYKSQLRCRHRVDDRQHLRQLRHLGYRLRRRHGWR